MRMSLDVKEIDNGYILVRDFRGLQPSQESETLTVGREAFKNKSEVRQRIIDILKELAESFEAIL